MPITQSAKKALRQTHTHRILNKSKKVSLAKQITLVKKQAGKGLDLLYSLADKAAKAGIIHSKKAARIKSRLAKKFP